MLENVHSTRFKREFCKPATKSDSKTTPEKGLVYFRDGDDCDGNDISNLKPLKLKKYQRYKPQDESGRFLCFYLACVLEHIR